MKYCDNDPALLYLDNHLLGWNKPSGISTQPFLTEHVKTYLQKRLHKSGNIFLHPLHRLDRVAAGIVLFARSQKALVRCNASLREREWKKEYLLLIEGKMQKKKGRLEHFLVHGEKRAYIHPKGKQSLLSYTVLEEGLSHTIPCSLVHVELHTGRYHQIRVQFGLGEKKPLVGDVLYGSSIRKEKEQIALCHAKLSLIHPVTKQLLVIEIPRPTFQQFGWHSKLIL